MCFVVFRRICRTTGITDVEFPIQRMLEEENRMALCYRGSHPRQSRLSLHARLVSGAARGLLVNGYFGGVPLQHSGYSIKVLIPSILTISRGREKPPCELYGLPPQRVPLSLDCIYRYGSNPRYSRNLHRRCFFRLFFSLVYFLFRISLSCFTGVLAESR